MGVFCYLIFAFNYFELSVIRKKLKLFENNKRGIVVRICKSKIRNREFDGHYIILLPSTLVPHFNVVSIVKDANVIMALFCFESIPFKVPQCHYLYLHCVISHISVPNDRNLTENFIWMEKPWDLNSKGFWAML